MRPDGIKRMDSILGRIDKAADVSVLDVGSFDVNGNFRNIVTKRQWAYTGLDIVDGPNVDIVSASPYEYPFRDGSFDGVISGYTIEHIPAFWCWLNEVARLVRSGGLIAIITHTAYPYHPHPVDCWRFMPDGIRYIFDRANCLHKYHIKTFGDGDIIGAAEKI